MSEPQIDWRKPENRQALSDIFEEADKTLSLISTSNPQLEIWHTKVLIGLLQTAKFAFMYLQPAWELEASSLAAWATRSLLEVDIWTDWVVRSKDNTYRFHQDWLNDTSEIMNHGAVLNSHRNSSKAQDSVYADLDFGGHDPKVVRDWLASEKDKAGMTESKYLNVGAIARELDRAAEFYSLNPILSKLAHPTAFSVLSFPSERARTNMAVFLLENGCHYSLRVLGRLNRYLEGESLPTFLPKQEENQM